MCMAWCPPEIKEKTVVSMYPLILKKKKSNFTDLSQKLFKVRDTCRGGRKLDEGEDAVCRSHFANIQISFPTFFKIKNFRHTTKFKESVVNTYTPTT